MHISFIFFILIVIAIATFSAYNLGKKISLAQKEKSPEAQNNINTRIV